LGKGQEGRAGLVEIRPLLQRGEGVGKISEDYGHDPGPTEGRQKGGGGEEGIPAAGDAEERRGEAGLSSLETKNNSRKGG